MAIVHATLNNIDQLDGAMLTELSNRTRNLDPQKRGEAMEQWEELAKLHAESSQVGQTEVRVRTECQQKGHLILYLVWI